MKKDLLSKSMVNQQNDNYLVFRNEPFNEICTVPFGSSILLLDSTHFESFLFVDGLLDRLPSANTVMALSSRAIGFRFPVTRIDLENLRSLTDLSVKVNDLRQTIGFGGVLVHEYLPHLLVREDDERILRMLESWTQATKRFRLVEFYSLPRSTFPEMERKAASFFDGEIILSMAGAERREMRFQVRKLCKPEYVFAEFPYTAQGGRLLIKWGGSFVESLPKEHKDEVSTRVSYLRENLYSLRLVKGGRLHPGADPYEFWFISQMTGRSLRDIQVLFPERFEDMLQLIARLNLRGLIEFEKVDAPVPTPPRNKLRLTTKLALALPTWLSLRFLHGEARYITMDAYVSLRQSFEAVAAYTRGTELSSWLKEFEIYYHEMTARATAVEKIRRNREDPLTPVDMKYLPKFVKLTLGAGLRMKCSVKTVGEGVYLVAISKCPICAGLRASTPVCMQVEATLRGVSGLCFKRKFRCNEINCQAMGNDACVFRIEIER